MTGFCIPIVILDTDSFLGVSSSTGTSTFEVEFSLTSVSGVQPVKRPTHIIRKIYFHIFCTIYIPP